jgi:phosphorylcholine metabolism protein LicD
MELAPFMKGARLENHKKGQQEMTNMLREFDKICRKLNISYWCDGGTFIGATRHQGWIPYDGDIDVAMLEKDYKIFKKQAHKLPDYIWLQDIETDKSYTNWHMPKLRHKYCFYTNYKRLCGGVQLDIFLYNCNNTELKTKLQSNHVAKGNSYRDFNIDIIYPLREGKFEDIIVYLPNNIEEYSIKVWGSYPLPLLPVEKRYPHEGPMVSLCKPFITNEINHNIIFSKLKQIPALTNF